jgi:hypothetical protein
LAVVVASPQLLEAQCNSIEQIKLVNTLCFVRRIHKSLGQEQIMKLTTTRRSMQQRHLPPLIVDLAYGQTRHQNGATVLFRSKGQTRGARARPGSQSV